MPFDEWNATHPSVSVMDFVGVQPLGAQLRNKMLNFTFVFPCIIV